MMVNWTDKLSNRAFSALKWMLSFVSAVLTTGLIVVLES